MQVVGHIGAILGWLGLGWGLAWLCVWRIGRRAAAAERRAAVEPRIESGLPPAGGACWSEGIYSPEAFLLSQRFGACTWAVCDGAHWALSYEVDGTQRLAGWLEDNDVPLEVRLSALEANPSCEDPT
jgi:hypothetical protein